MPAPIPRPATRSPATTPWQKKASKPNTAVDQFTVTALASGWIRVSKCGWISVSGIVEAEGGVLGAFVLGVDQSGGLLLVPGGERLLLAGVGVFAVINAPTPAKRAVTILHIRVHVLSMNPPAAPPLTSSGPVGAGPVPVVPE